MSKVQIQTSNKEIADFCRKHHIRKLAFFGSVLRSDFGPASDVDVLVEFEPDHPIGFLGLAMLEMELSALLHAPVDIRTAQELSPYFRQDVLNSAEVHYEQG
ncbi:MAG: nucleotidyltransferase [Chloroflexi bacterium]|nr:MAG: nucleotidyltransferase [Chloroflexota bacterium]